MFKITLGNGRVFFTNEPLEEIDKNGEETVYLKDISGLVQAISEGGIEKREWIDKVQSGEITYTKGKRIA